MSHLGYKFAFSISTCLVSSMLLTSCYFFRPTASTSTQSEVAQSMVIGGSFATRAGRFDQAELQGIYAIDSEHPPAALRADPDTYVRRLLLRFRDEGALVAREIGRVEQFRGLLGGANEDFTNPPQESFDATSLLANYKVSEEICRGLVAPDAHNYPGWQTILMQPITSPRQAIHQLAADLMGLPSAEIDEDRLDQLLAIYEQSLTIHDGLDAYIAVCAAILLDAEALLL